MNFLKRGLINSFKAIQEHKVIFTFLIILEIIFIILFSLVSLIYQVKIFEQAQQIMTTLETANYDAESIKAGEPFSENLSLVYQNYKQMINSLLLMSLWLILIFVFINGSSWVLVHKMFEEYNKISLKKTSKQALKFLVSSVILIGPFLAGAYYLFKLLLQTQQELNSFALIFQIGIYSFLIGYYFLMVAFAVIGTESWRLFFKNWFKLAFKKIHLTLLVMLLILILILICLSLVYLTLNPNLFILMILSALILIIVMVLIKIFWVACLKQLLSADEK